MHALRHYYASALLESSVSIRAVSEYLGHPDPGFTLRIYAHLMPTSGEKARQAIDVALTPHEPESMDLATTPAMFYLVEHD